MMLFMYWLGLRLHLPGRSFSRFEITDSTDVSGVLVDIDYSWGSDVGPAPDFAEETLGCSSAPGLIQEKIECLAGRIDSSIQIHPLASDFDIGFVNPPGIIGLFQNTGDCACQFLVHNAGPSGRWWCDQPISLVRISFLLSLYSSKHIGDTSGLLKELFPVGNVAI